MSKKRDFLPFEEAREVVRELNITSVRDWEKLSTDIKHSLGVPACPALYYKDKGWTDWEDFLRGEPRHKTYEEARALARTLGIKSSYEWFGRKHHLHKGIGIPFSPQLTYKDKGWAGWSDFLGVIPYKSFEEARALARLLGIKSSYEWVRTKPHLRKYIGLPPGPHNYYKKRGWISWDDFLGRDKKA